MPSDPLHRVVEHLRAVFDKKDAVGKPDGELLTRYVRERDAAAFEALERRHGPMVYGVCRRVLRNLHDAEDAFQATFLVLVRKAAGLRSPATIGNWLYGVAYRTALHARNLTAKRRAREAEMPAPLDSQKETSNELRAALDLELDRLSEKHRTLVVLCDLEGRTRREAAALLNLPEGTVASRLAKARTLLAKRLARHGVMLSAGSLAVAMSAEAASICVPISWIHATTKAAGALAAGTAAAVLSGKVTVLTHGVLKMMLISKLKNMTVVLATVAVLGSAAAGVAYHGGGWGSGGDSTSLATNELPSDEPNNGKPQAQDAKAQIERLQAENNHLTVEIAKLNALRAQEENALKIRMAKLDADHEAAQKALRNENDLLKALAAKLAEELKVTKKALQSAFKKDEDGKISQYIITLPHANAVDGNTLMALILNTVEPHTWAPSGGVGTIGFHPPSKSLVINHYRETYEKVTSLLDLIEREQADKRKLAKSFVTKVYPVADLAGKDSEELVRIITNTLEPDSWLERWGDGVIEYFHLGRTIVIRHSPEMHAKVAEFLTELRKGMAQNEKKGG